MPIRRTPLVTGYIYHIFNRGINKAPIFRQKKDYQRLLDLIAYCCFADYPVKFSKFKDLAKERKEEIRKNLKEKFVEIIAYVLMPNHFHLLVQQKKENGISCFVNRFLDSYTKFFNRKYERSGPLFEGRFKAVLIETESQLLHVVRYIHLNPYSSVVVKTLEELLAYPWSSFPEYLGKIERGIISAGKQLVLSQFNNMEDFKEFTLNQADYQRRLEEIKHLLLEK